MEFNIGFPGKIANFEVHFVWSGKKKKKKRVVESSSLVREEEK